MKRLEDMTEPELRELMNAAGKAVELTCTSMGVERPLFTLLLFNDPKIAQYVSNCRRSDMVAALRETAGRIGRREDTTR